MEEINDEIEKEENNINIKDIKEKNNIKENRKYNNIQNNNNIYSNIQKNYSIKNNIEINNVNYFSKKSQNKNILINNNKQNQELIKKAFNDNNNKIKINNFFLETKQKPFNFVNILEKSEYISPSQNKKLENKEKNNTNIFQRLFKEAQYKRIFPKKPCHFRYKKTNKFKEFLTFIESDKNKELKKINLKIGNKISNNYGEYLYERDKKNQEEKEKRIMLIKQKKMQDEKQFYPFKPNVNKTKNQIKPHKSNISYEEKRNNFNLNDINENIKKYSYINSKEKPIEKNNYVHNKYQGRENINNKYKKNDLFYNHNNNKKIINKSRIPFDKKRSNKNTQKIVDSNSKTKTPSHKSFINNTNNYMFSFGDNKTIFLNLFNSLDTKEKNEISGNNINMKKIPKNILRIINPIIKDLLNNKNKKITKDEFITQMNDLFYNISPIDKRLLIYTYNIKHNKNISFIINNNINNNYVHNFHQIHNRAETPNFSMKNKYFKNIENNDNNYSGYKESKKQFNNLKNNLELQSSKAQKNIENFLYGKNSNYNYGF